MRTQIIVCFLLLFVAGTYGACPRTFPRAAVARGYCAYEFATGFGTPRGIWVNSFNEILLVQRSPASIQLLWEEGGTVHKTTLATQSGINHAIVYQNGYLYASSATTVYRWRYVEGNRTALGTAQVVVSSLPCCGHTTRSLELDSKGLLYVQSGSNNNVDSDSSQSVIRRYNISTIPNNGLAWNSGELYASGIRNEVGIRFDSTGRLWGVENGCDNLNRNDLGGDIHADNPSEEFNLLDVGGKFYGYPYCWSEYRLTQNQSQPVGAQWAHPTFINDGTHTDAWCRNTANVVTPAYNFPAHVAPLDILFYNGGTLPAAKGDAFVTFRGSWNRQPPQGYRVVHVTFQNGKPVNHDAIFYYEGPGETATAWTVRPVGLALYKCGGNKECILVTSDADNRIIAITAE